MDAQHERTVRRFRHRLMRTLALRYGLMLLAAWGFLWGAAVLVARAAIGAERTPLLWGLLGIIPVAALAIDLARRKTPGIDAVRATLDGRSRAGGLLMAGGEATLDGWSTRLPAVTEPGLRWRAGRSCGLLLTAAVFVGVGFLMPQRLMSVSTARPLNIDGPSQQLAEQIDLLEEERIIEEDRAADLEKKLDQVRREASADDPMKTWESLDHVERSLQKESERTAEEAIAETQELSEAQSLAEALAEDQAKQSPSLSPEMTAEAMSHLAETVKNLAAKDEQFKKALKQQNLDPEQLEKLAEQARQGEQKLSPEQMKQLRKLAAQSQAGKAGKADKLSKLVRAQLLDPKRLGQCKSAGQCSGKGLASFLKKNGGKGGGDMSMSGMMAAWCNGGKVGGINRGPGDAPMTWKDPSDEAGSKFEAQTLPQSSPEAMQDSVKIGVSAGAPEVNEDAQVTDSAAMRGAEAGGGSATEQRVLPQHRDAVRRYFDRE